MCIDVYRRGGDVTTKLEEIARKLTNGQIRFLRMLAESPAKYHTPRRRVGNASTGLSLQKRGLATVKISAFTGNYVFRITGEGLAELTRKAKEAGEGL